jgi:hypothetical protein
MAAAAPEHIVTLEIKGATSITCQERLVTGQLPTNTKNKFYSILSLAFFALPTKKQHNIAHHIGYFKHTYMEDKVIFIFYFTLTW